MILSTCPFGLFQKKEKKRTKIKGQGKGRFQMLYDIIWFWSEMYLIVKKNKKAVH